MGHFESNLAQVKHVDICPHSKIKQSIRLDIQILHKSESWTSNPSGRSRISFWVGRLAEDDSLRLLLEADGIWLLILCAVLLLDSMAGAEAFTLAIPKQNKSNKSNLLIIK